MLAELLIDYHQPENHRFSDEIRGSRSYFLIHRNPLNIGNKLWRRFPRDLFLKIDFLQNFEHSQENIFNVAILRWRCWVTTGNFFKKCSSSQMFPGSFSYCYGLIYSENILSKFRFLSKLSIRKLRVIIIKIVVSKSEDWLLYDKNLHHEIVKNSSL